MAASLGGLLETKAVEDGQNVATGQPTKLGAWGLGLTPWSASRSASRANEGRKVFALQMQRGGLLKMLHGFIQRAPLRDDRNF